MLKENEIAPDFQLKDQDGKLHKLSDYRGKKIVLYFYPKDMTPGCTKEACSFRDNIDEFKKNNIIVLGVSADSVESHKKFENKHSLNFPLLADTEKEVVNRYRVFGEKKFMGKTYMGINRTTFIIDEQSKIIKVFPKVKVEGHSEEIINYLKNN